MKLPFVAVLFLVAFFVIIVLIFVWLFFEIKDEIDKERIRFFVENQDTVEASPSSRSISEIENG